MTNSPGSRVRRMGAAAVIALSSAAPAAGLAAPAVSAYPVPAVGSLQVAAGPPLTALTGAGIPAGSLADLGLPVPSPGPGVTRSEGLATGAPRDRSVTPLVGAVPVFPTHFPAGHRVTAWGAWEPVGPDATALRVAFANGLAWCEGAAVHVVESDTAVSIEILTGTLPEAVGRPCPAVAVPYAVTVDLGGPLAGRVVLDAAG